MLEQQAFEHRTGHPLLLGRKLAHGFELRAQIIIRPTLAVLKKWLQIATHNTCQPLKLWGSGGLFF
jgi:hypothetical protein